jgi:enoyl-CoA hydratase/carnithine racemase
MTMPELHREEDVCVLDVGDDENRFSLDWLMSISALLDEVSNQPAPRALVTMARGKFYSNGLDLDWVLAHPDQRAPISPTCRPCWPGCLPCRCRPSLR